LRVVIDIEANGLENPTKIWCIVCKDIDSGKVYVFREGDYEGFIEFAKGVTLWIGHNLLGYDQPVIDRLVGSNIVLPNLVCDTLIISKLNNYSRDGHSVEDYGEEFGLPKGDNHQIAFFTKWSKELEDYCIRDVEITERIYKKYARFIGNPKHSGAISLEHNFQLVVNDLHTTGFSFNRKKAGQLLEKVEKELAVLDKDILDAFPPRDVLIREFIPKFTKFGTISRTSVPRALHSAISTMEAGKNYRYTKAVEFNPASHKQLIEVLHEARWQPTDKTKTHLDKERELNQLKRQNRGNPAFDVVTSDVYNSIQKLEKYGWKINENNLSTLPPDAPPAAKLLAKRILLEARRLSLTEWLSLVQEDGRIHGKFYGIGAWTHRMAHQAPNTANIPNELREDGSVKLLGKEMRSLWCAPRNRLLVGVDAEGIQLRIFAHYINDPEFTDALHQGSKDEGTDPHSLNKRILGSVCKSRQAAKRFIYALLLGAGLKKLAEILGCTEDEAREALDRLLERYTGFAFLKREVIPKDAKRGWFLGLDGRPVRIPGDTEGSRRHLCMSGYLQNGEAIVVKETTIKTLDKIRKESLNAILVNVVHDEVIFEIPNDVRLGEHVSDLFCRSIEEVGRELNLKCPLAGDGHVGLNWYEIH
jgi:DNA polymerase-1